MEDAYHTAETIDEPVVEAVSSATHNETLAGADDISAQMLALYAQIGQAFVHQLFNDPDGLHDEVQQAIETVRQLRIDPIEAIRSELAQLREAVSRLHTDTSPAPTPSEAAQTETAPAETAPTPSVRDKLFSPRGSTGTGKRGKSLREIIGL